MWGKVFDKLELMKIGLKSNDGNLKMDYFDCDCLEIVSMHGKLGGKCREIMEMRVNRG